MMWLLLGLKVLEVGDSNARGVRAMPEAGLPIQPEFRVVDNGVELFAWPTTSPTAGIGPSIAALGEGWWVRRAANGETAGTCITSGRWELAKADVAAMGEAPDVVVFVLGANDSRRELTADRYLPKMTILLDEAAALWPEAELVVARERRSDAVTSYPFLRTTIYSAQDALGVRIADGTACSLWDGIHWDAPGQECLAALILNQ